MYIKSRQGDNFYRFSANSALKQAKKRQKPLQKTRSKPWGRHPNISYINARRGADMLIVCLKTITVRVTLSAPIVPVPTIGQYYYFFCSAPMIKIYYKHLYYIQNPGGVRIKKCRTLFGISDSSRFSS